MLNAAELSRISKYEDELTELNLDDNEGFTKEELASYILAADGLARLKDATYAGWEFLPGADITEEDLKISIYEASITDGVIDDKNLFALEKMNTKDLKEAAQEIYDANFKNKCNGFVSFLKNVIYSLRFRLYSLSDTSSSHSVEPPSDGTSIAR